MARRRLLARMVMARIGGGALVVGGLLGIGLVAIALGGGGVGLGSSSGSALLLAAFSAALGLGAGTLSLAARSGYSPLVRLGLGLDAAGWLGLAVTAQANTDPGPQLIVLLAAFAFLAIGALVTAVGLLRVAGWERLAGAALLVGVAALGLDNATLAGPSTILIAGIPLGFLLVGLQSVRRSMTAGT